MRTAIFGGTFDTIHEGHKRLFEAAKAFPKIIIGLTTSEFANKPRNYRVKSYARRKAALARFLKPLHKNFQILPISDKYGISTSARGIHAIIVSEETESVANEINKIRKARRLPKLKIICVPLKFALDYKKLSAEFVFFRKTDKSGKRLSKVRFALGSQNPSKINGAKKALSHLLNNNFSLHPLSFHSGVPSQPFAKQAIIGAINRAKNAYKAMKGKADFGIGLESGLFSFGAGFHDVLFCAIWDGQHLTLGNSMGFELPESIVKEIKSKNSELGHVVSRLSKTKEIGKKGGAISYLSGGLLTREQMIEQAVLCAFVPRIYKSLH